jgi:hypothetical protein
MDLKEEIIQNVKAAGLSREEEKSILEEIEEIWDFEDNLEEDGGASRKRIKSARRKKAEHTPK